MLKRKLLNKFVRKKEINGMLQRGIWIGLATVLVISLCFAENNRTIQERPYNLILIINDQETNHLLAKGDYQLPARQAIRNHGVTFTNHYTAAAMCSPSRATFLTGVTPQVHGVFDQVDYSFVPSLDPKRPNMGSILKNLGYRTAYFGKFEMDKKLLVSSPTTNYSTLAKAYGFDVFNYDGDVSGEPLQGYTHDIYYVGEAIRWLKKNAVSSKTKQPFFMVISLLNPHDIMFGDANIANLPVVQKAQVPVIFSPPATSLYAKKWQFTLSPTLAESLTTSGMPNAFSEYQKGWSGTLGYIPTDRTDMWRNYYNYYLNTLQDNDHSLQLVIDTINQMGLWENTVVILTADHGEMGGAHGGLRGKGPMAYEENAHIPLVIAHPKTSPGTTCSALTSHLDLLPTLVGLTGLPQAKVKESNQFLPGHDFSKLLADPTHAPIHAIRSAVLFNYVGVTTIDGDFLVKMLTAAFSHKQPPRLEEINLSKRGLLSFVFDGQYKFARYYAPNKFNTPETLAEILDNNDVQLFDLKADPMEIYNLALQPEKNKLLILRMNKLLNELMRQEVGKNDGKFLPESIRPKM
jgi:arylsulfatase A-like enzyme